MCLWNTRFNLKLALSLFHKQVKLDLDLDFIVFPCNFISPKAMQ